MAPRRRDRFAIPAISELSENVSASVNEARMMPRGEEKSRRVSGWVGGIVVALALISALLTFLVLSGAPPIVPVHEVVVCLLYTSRCV